MKKRDILKEVYTERQRRWACWQASLPAKERKEGLSKEEAKEMCYDVEHSLRKEYVTPKMKKKDLLEYIKSKKVLNEQRDVHVIPEFDRPDYSIVFRWLEKLRESGVINMFGCYPMLNWAKDDLYRWLYGQKQDPDSIKEQIEDLEYENEDGDYDSEIQNLEEQLETIEYLLENKQAVRDVLVRAALKRIDNTTRNHELSNVQRVFEKLAKESWLAWTSMVYG